MPMLPFDGRGLETVGNEASTENLKTLSSGVAIAITVCRCRQAFVCRAERSVVRNRRVVSRENGVTDSICRRVIYDGPQKGEAATLAVDAVLSGRERDVPFRAAAPFPDRKADQLQ